MEPMVTSWVLFAALSANPQPIQVYVDTNPPDWKSRHVIDALQTPIESLFNRCPNDSASCYLWELDIARGRLAASGGVQIISRDDSGLPSYIDLPAWSFSHRDAPRPFVEGVYYHWTLVPEHLEYLLNIKQWGVSNHRKKSYVLSTRVDNNHDWFVIRSRTRPVEELFKGHSLLGKETVSVAVLRFLPSPPVLHLPTPRKVSRKLTKIEDEIVIENTANEAYHCTPEIFNKWLEAADMSTGIIKIETPKPEETE